MKKILLGAVFVLFTSIIFACTPPVDMTSTTDGTNTTNTQLNCPVHNPSLNDIDFENNKIALNFLGPSAGTFDIDKDPTKELIQELTGYDVTYEELPQSNATEALNLRLGSRDQFNAVKVTKNQYENLVQQCALLDLSAYIDKYGNNIKNAISDKSWEAVTIGNAIYGIPEAVSSENIDYTIGIRQDWLDELDLQLPTTLDEFTDMLQAFDDYFGVDNLGRPKSAFKALTLDKNNYVIPSVASAFGLYTDWQDIDGELIAMTENPKFKDYLDYMKQLFNDGLLDESVASNDFSTSMTKFAQGNAGAIVMAWWNSIAVADALRAGGQIGAEITYMMPLEDEAGVRLIKRGTGVPYITVIPAYMAENAPWAIDWIDSKLEPSNFKEMVIGKENVHFTYRASDDTYYPGYYFNEKENSSWFLTGTIEEDYAKYWQARVRKSDDMYASWYAINQYADDIGIYDPLAFAPSIPEYSEYANRLANNTLAFAIPYIFTNDSKTYENYVNEWKNNGGQELSDALNNWYQNR
jgi:putative aldouronate transport system substrate-binding protein